MRKANICLLAVMLVLAGFLPAFFVGIEPAMAQGYTWTDTRGPGNGEGNALLFLSSRNQLYRGSSRGVWVYDPATGAWSDTGGGLSAYSVDSLGWDERTRRLALQPGEWKLDGHRRRGERLDHQRPGLGGALPLRGHQRQRRLAL
jgi:hypothetical protein